MVRKIIHIDMDCFYAAVELRDRPDLVGKPVAVGGAKRRGVLTTCNYEARKYGCHSGMAGFKALQLCPKLILLPVDFEKYRAESKKIHQVFKQYTDIIEPLSLDEAFLDVSHQKDRFAWNIAKEIRATIYKQTQLTASAGIAPNKMLAKIASDWRKPNGQFAIQPHEIENFMKALPVSKIGGVGRKTQERLEKIGISTCQDLQEYSPYEIDRRLGKFGRDLIRLSRGEDDRMVMPKRERKSMSSEHTLQEDVTSIDSALDHMSRMCEELRNDFRKSRHKDRVIHKLFVKLKFSDFRSTTKECVGGEIESRRYEELLKEAWTRGNDRVRLIGVGVRFVPLNNENDHQLALDLG